jgi:hypothetical protein
VIALQTVALQHWYGVATPQSQLGLSFPACFQHSSLKRFKAFFEIIRETFFENRISLAQNTVVEMLLLWSV